MNADDGTVARDGAPIFFAFGGFIIAIILSISHATQWAGGTLTLEWFALGAIAPLYAMLAIATVLVPTLATSWTRHGAITARFALGATYLVAGVELAMQAHRLYFLAIALAQVALIWGIARAADRRLGVSSLALFALSFVSWIMTAGLSYTATSSLFMNAARSSSAFAIAFVAALVLAICDVFARDFSAGNESAALRRGREGLIVAGLTLFFAEIALRTDGLWTDWIPYHRSYFTGIATFVRQGHWLLWDVPSQYGFLSIVTLAFAPGRTTWESSYLLTAAMLTVETLMLYLMLRAGRAGLANRIFAALAAPAVFLSDQADRWPFGPRVYPQHGLRFVWLYALLFVVFQIYANRAKPTVARRFTILGHAAWALGIFWAFESAVWCTLVWGGFLFVTATVQASTDRTFRDRLRCFANVLILPAIALVALATIDIFYLVRLGHFPDWIAYFEFSSLYLGPPIAQEKADPFGPAWFLVLALGAVGTASIIAIASRKWSLLPTFAALWAATWGTSVYYAGEPFSDHVNALLGIFAFAGATIAYVASSEALFAGPIWLVRASFLPMFVTLIATWLGNVDGLARLRVPLLPGYHFDVTADVSPISGELADLMHSAGITSTDKVILPDNVGWSKIDTGLIVPLFRDPDGHVREITAWLPLGPAGPDNTSDTLPLARRLIYFKRFTDVAKTGGWYIVYHDSAECRVLMPEAYDLVRIASKNYSMARCGLRRPAGSLARSNG